MTEPNRLWLIGLLCLVLLAGGLATYALVPGGSDDATVRQPQIAFVSLRDGNAEIYVMNGDGSKQARLTESPRSDLNPAWSPDSRRIAFFSTPLKPVGAEYEVHVVNVDGSGPRKLSVERPGFDANNPLFDFDAAWSADGRRIAFVSVREDSPNPVYNWDIYTINADGSGLKRITDLPSPAGVRSPAWSPDGSRIAFVWAVYPDLGWSIYVMNQDGSQQANLTGGKVTGNPLRPIWSPDGERIAFSSWSEINRPQGVYVINADGSGLIRVATSALTTGRLAWAPDSSRIAFAPERRDGDISVVRVDGTGLNKIAEGRSPAWSPDGRTIAFVSARSGNDEVYVVNADGSGLRNLTNHPADDRMPAWSPGAQKR